MAKKRVLFVTTALSTSGILLCQSMGKELDCEITIFPIEEKEEVQRDFMDQVECIIISLESPKDMEGLKKLYKKWRSSWPAMPMIFLIPDINMKYHFIKGELDYIFEDENQRLGVLVKMIRKVLEES
jgi:hypothetical protein